ncbi:VWA domain-containing protein [Agromyces sp. SYSU K20354]|uniref:vWA domain-containing protein n=1 Tax=Agromyces cavernae TaxID=2898659 RepID=UPI001E54ABF4|nr:vWA domain-containing protein [Agromyces cavernae]MCD2443052.1 VWA domain-containing protein [Agromyces cavernae]
MGIGRLVGNHFDLIVSIRHNAAQARVDEWEASFAQASRLLWDATDGQHRFGTIWVCNNSSGGRNADAWLLEPDGRSVSAVDALGSETAHMTLYGDERFKPFIVIHEFGHYGYGVYDEYNGSAGAAECIGGTTSDACIMESAWSDGDRFGNAATGGALVSGRVSEFCVAGNHDPDGDTDQDEVHGVACWQTMVANHPGLTVPAGTPSAPAPGGAGTITWVVLAPEQRYVLVIDRSGSMQGNKIDQALIGSDWWADNAQNNDRLGVVSFATTTRTDIGLTTITSDADRVAVQNAIGGIAAGGQTAIGDGLRQGLNEILAAGQRAATQVIVLLTDGLHNLGENPGAVIPDLTANGVRVYTIGVGPSIDSTLLQAIASGTGGTYYRIDPTLSASAQEFRIRTVLQEISGVARDNGGVVTTRPEEIAEEKLIERRVLIEDGSESATFAVTWEGQPGGVALELESPDGVSISLGSFPAEARPIDSGFPYTGFQIEKPTPGEWTIVIRSEGGATGRGQLYVFSQNPHVDGALFTPTPQYAPGDVIPLFLQTYFDQPLSGLQVSGVATLPDGSTAPVRFGDDGDPLTGDAVPKDGMYSALFDETHDLEGIYTFQVAVVSDGVSAFYPEVGERLVVGDAVNTNPIPAFERRFALSVVVGEEKIREPEHEDEKEPDRADRQPYETA